MHQHDRNILEKNRPALVKEIETDQLFPNLRQKGLVDSELEEKIKDSGPRPRQVENILDRILRCGEHAFGDFCDALEESGQGRIVKDYLRPAVKRNAEQDHSMAPGTPIFMPSVQNGKCTKIRKHENTLPKQFQMAWKVEFPWIVYDEAANKMYCELCRQCGKRVTWANTGSNNFCRKSILNHMLSYGHRKSAETAQQLVSPQKVSQQDITSALRVCYHVLTEDLPDRKFQSFLKHLQDDENGPFEFDCGMFYQLVKCLYDTIGDQMKSEIRRSEHIGIRLDEWADNISEKYLMVSARYVLPNAQVKTAFVKCISDYNGQVDRIEQAIQDLANDYQVPLTKIVGVGTDCTSVIAHKLNDMVVRLKEDNPHMVFLHCVCHRMNLAMSQVSDKVRGIAVLQSVVAAAYTFVSMKQDRLDRVPDMAAVSNLRSAKVQSFYDVRWLKFDAIHALLKNYEPLMTLVQKEAALDDTLALGLNIQLSRYIYLALLHLVADILSTC